MAKRADATTARNTVIIATLARTIIVERMRGGGAAGMGTMGVANSRIDMDGTTAMVVMGTLDMDTVAMGSVAMGTETMPSSVADAAVATLADSLTIAAAGIIMLIAATDHIVRGTAERGGVTDQGVASTLQGDPLIGAAVTIVVSLLGAVRTTDRMIFHTDTMDRTRAVQSSSPDDTLMGGTPAVGATRIQRDSRITASDRTTADITRIMRSFALSEDIRITGDIILLPTIAITVSRTATQKDSRRRMEREAANHRRTERKPVRLISLRLTRQRVLVAAAAVRVGNRCAKPC